MSPLQMQIGFIVSLRPCLNLYWDDLNQDAILLIDYKWILIIDIENTIKWRLSKLQKFF